MHTGNQVYYPHPIGSSLIFFMHPCILIFIHYYHRVRQFFYCPQGYTARVIDTVTGIDLNENGRASSLASVVDLDQLSQQLNTTVALQCEKIRKSMADCTTPVGNANIKLNIM